MALGGGNSGGSASGIKAGSAYVELGLKNFLPRDLINAQKQFEKLGSAFSSIGRKMALGGVAALTPLVGMASTLNDLSKQGSIANALGLTAEQFTGIAGVAKSVGNDTKEFIESLVTLGKLGTDAAAGTEQASAAFASMGLNANEFIKLRADEQFFAVFDAMNQMQDPLQRTRALMMAFGEDGGKILLPLLGKSSEELKAMAKGFAVSTDDMKAATAASSAYAAAGNAISKAWQSVSIAAAPIVKIIADGLASAATPLTNFIAANKEIVVGLGLAAGGLTTVGLGLMVLGPAIAALASSWSLFTGAVAIGKTVIVGTFAALVSPILVLPAAIAAAGAAWLAFTTEGRSAVTGFAGAIASAFGPTMDNLKNSWSSIVAAVQDGDLQSAFKIGIGAIKVEWLRFQVFLNETWNKFISSFTAGWGNAQSAFAIVLVNTQRRLGIITKEAADASIKTILQMDDEANRRAMQNPAQEAGMKELRQQLRDAEIWQKIDIAGARMDREDRGWFGGGGDWGGGNEGVLAQLNSIAAASRGGFGGSISAGMFGGGDGVKQIVNAVEKVEKAIKWLGPSRHDEKMGQLAFAEGE